MIEFRHVSKTYHTGTHALKDVSFKIMDGEFVFVIGRSGAGKSTLIKLLTCEETTSEGSVLIDDFDISKIRRSLVPYLRRNIGMVFQDFRLIYTKTVYENVAFAMEIVGASRRSIQRRVPIVLSIVGLKDKAHDKPGELSGGEQQRVAIARAMVNNPMLILADEPTGNLDPLNSESVMALLEEINRGGTTVIICTHDHELVDKMVKRVIEIKDGYVVRDECQGIYDNCSDHIEMVQKSVAPAEVTPVAAESVTAVEGKKANQKKELAASQTVDQVAAELATSQTVDSATELAASQAIDPAAELAKQEETDAKQRPAASPKSRSTRQERVSRAVEQYREYGHDVFVPELLEQEQNSAFLSAQKMSSATKAASKNIIDNVEVDS